MSITLNVGGLKIKNKGDKNYKSIDTFNIGSGSGGSAIKTMTQTEFDALEVKPTTGIIGIRDAAGLVFAIYDMEYYKEVTEYIPVMASNTAPYGTASVDIAPYRGQAYNAFDGDDTTVVYGGSSRNTVIVRYIDENREFNPTKFRFLDTSSTSGNNLNIYGWNADTQTWDKIWSGGGYTHGQEFFGYISSDTVYNGFTIEVTGGSTSNTPCLASFQVYGYEV